jgi:nucleotide-binding universal stress UspA family protein
LAPTDLGRGSKAAVEYAHTLAETVGAELHVLHVVKSADDLAREHGVATVIEPGSRDEFDQYLADLLGESGTVRRVEAVRQGSDAADVIAEYVRDSDIDLLVAATHGREGLSHLFQGSVAEKLLRVSPCPVLVLRG